MKSILIIIFIQINTWKDEVDSTNMVDGKVDSSKDWNGDDNKKFEFLLLSTNLYSPFLFILCGQFVYILCSTSQLLS